MKECSYGATFKELIRHLRQGKPILSYQKVTIFNDAYFRTWGCIFGLSIQYAECVWNNGKAMQ